MPEFTNRPRASIAKFFDSPYEKSRSSDSEAPYSDHESPSAKVDYSWLKSIAEMSSSQSHRNMPADIKDHVSRYCGSTKFTAQFFRQIKTSFEDAEIELTPRRFFNVINMRVSGEALEVLEQNRRIVKCLDDSSTATEDDMVMCKDLLMTRFAPVEQEVNKDWMAELRDLKQEGTESLESYYNRTVALLKNLDLTDGKIDNSTAEKHLLNTVCMAYYTGLYDTTLKRRILQVKGWSKNTSLLQMHNLALDEKNDMEQQERVEQQLKDAECIKMLQELRSGSVTQNEFNAFLSSFGPITSFSSQASIAPKLIRNSVNPEPDGSHLYTNQMQSSYHKPQSHTGQSSLVKGAYQPVGNDNVDTRINQQQSRSIRRLDHNIPNTHRVFPSQRNDLRFSNYDRSTSSNPYVNGTKIIQGEQVCLICGNSGHVATRGGVNCSPGSKRLELIESAILRSLLFPNDRNVESNMSLIKSRYFNDIDQQLHVHQPSVLEFIPDNIESNMVNLNQKDSQSFNVSYTVGDEYVDNLDKLDADVFAYEPAGPKRVRLDEKDSEEDQYHIQRAIEANERESRERRSRREDLKGKGKMPYAPAAGTRPEKFKAQFNAIPLTTKGPKRLNGMKLRTIVGREGKGPLDYKKMLEDTTITMSMMDFYQASPDFSKSCRKYSTRMNEKKTSRKRIPDPEYEEETLLVEASSSEAKQKLVRDLAFHKSEESMPLSCKVAFVDQPPKVDLTSHLSFKTTARKDRAFRIPGEVILKRDGKQGKIYLDSSMVCADQGSDLILISPQLVRVLNLERKAFADSSNQVITMGTADGTSHRITESVSFIFSTGGICREIYAFVRPERDHTVDLFLLLGLPWLHSVKAVIDICRSQIRIGNKDLNENFTVLQGPTFEFAHSHRLLLEPTKVPFQGALRMEDAAQNNRSVSNRLKMPTKQINHRKDIRNFHRKSKSKDQRNSEGDECGEGDFSISDTEDSDTTDESSYDETQNDQDFNSASTDEDFSQELNYSSDEHSEYLIETNLGKDRVTRTT